MSLVKCKPGLIANTWQVACTKKVWLRMDDQVGRIYLVPMVATYDSEHMIRPYSRIAMYSCNYLVV